MNRTTISLTPEEQKWLRITAAERGTSMSELIRELIEDGREAATDTLGQVAAPRRPKSLGIVDSGHSDTSELAGETLPRHLNLPQDLQTKLSLQAAERGISTQALIQEALEEKTSRRKRKFISAGIGASAYTDTAETAGDMKFEPRSWR